MLFSCTLLQCTTTSRTGFLLHHNFPNFQSNVPTVLINAFLICTVLQCTTTSRTGFLLHHNFPTTCSGCSAALILEPVVGFAAPSGSSSIMKYCPLWGRARSWSTAPFGVELHHETPPPSGLSSTYFAKMDITVPFRAAMALRATTWP